MAKNEIDKKIAKNKKEINLLFCELNGNFFFVFIIIYWRIVFKSFFDYFCV